MKLLVFLLVGAVSVDLVATEPPCRFPTCFPGDRVLESRVFTASHQELQIHRLGRLEKAEMVLVRLVRAKGGSTSLVRGYLVFEKESVGFLRYPEPGFPQLTLDGPWGRAKFVRMKWAAAEQEVTLAFSPAITAEQRPLAVTREFRAEVAESEWKESQRLSEQELGKVIDRIHSACHSRLSFRLERGSWKWEELDSLDLGDLPYRCAELLEPLVEVCTHKQPPSLEWTRGVVCHYSLKPRSSVTLRKNGEIFIEASLRAPRDGKGSFDSRTWFEAQLK